MREYPVAAVRLPSSLVCQVNGELDPSVLRTIGLGGARLELTAARSWDALWGAGQSAGWDLTWTPGGTYRTYAAQRSLFLQRWSPVKIAGRPRVEWSGGSWWLKPGVARSAIPGTSNHGLGLAIDIALGESPASARPITPALDWLLSAADTFSFTWESQDEPWHLRYVSGDQIPEATLAWEASIGATS